MGVIMVEGHWLQRMKVLRVPWLLELVRVLMFRLAPMPVVKVVEMVLVFRIAS